VEEIIDTGFCRKTENKMLEDVEEDGRNINLVLKSMVVKTLDLASRIN
jgi:hypothetical protein